MSTYNLNTGNRGEDTAAEYIFEKGFSIISRNYRAGRSGEIDIVARSNDLIVFFEVKTRNTGRYGGALYSISKRKIESMKHCARHFINYFLSSNEKNCSFRFDLISIQDGNIEWVEDIIRW